MYFHGGLTNPFLLIGSLCICEFVNGSYNFTAALLDHLSTVCIYGLWSVAEGAVSYMLMKFVLCHTVLTDGKPALLSQTRSDSGKGWKHKETTSHVSVQRRPCVCSTEDFSQVSLVTFLMY